EQLTIGRSFEDLPLTSPTSFKASILQFCVDALKHRLEFGNGEQFTIGMLKSVTRKTRIF
ncbi:hypothetical protein, partial [Treponema phagedenis]|uniref:hypothetical protein n=1 Tax=Treponema phagedenis TaxID=162 RepID=UPI001C0684C7